MSHLQLEALDLAGLGPGQFGHEFHRARILVRRDLRLHVVLQPLRARLAPGHARLQDDVRLHDLAAIGIGRADDGALRDILVRQEGRLDLRPGDVVAGGNDHVVGTGDEVEDAVRVSEEIVPRQVEAVAHVRRLTIVRKIPAAGRSTHRQVADGAVRHFLHVVVDDAGLVPGDGPAGRTGRAVLEAIADENVQQFSGADAVEDRLAGSPRPVLEHRRRQCLPRGDRHAQRG